MDKVITINDWWDGPVIGLATYNGMICIYFRVFDIPTDEYEDEYFLTPIGDAEAEQIMNEWTEWCAACSKNNLDAFYKKYLNHHAIHQVLERSGKKNTYRKKAAFTGSIGKGWIPADFRVEWRD